MIWYAQVSSMSKIVYLLKQMFCDSMPGIYVHISLNTSNLSHFILNMASFGSL